MAKRPIFLPYSDGLRFVQEVPIEFNWSPGFAPIQKKKNIVALHQAAKAKGYDRLLEVSTKSEERLGQDLSAFNMTVGLECGRKTTIECAFQGSKLFELGGPFVDIYLKTSWEAKKDERTRSSGRIIGFRFEGYEIPSEPKTAFYDWLYARALARNVNILTQIESYGGFTDIEFNPEKSINCQARSCALVVSLHRKGLLNDAVSSPARFIEIVSTDAYSQPYSHDVRQGQLFDVPDNN
jgi:hypothetical protein